MSGESAGLLAVGELPKMSRSPGRRPGKWRGHERAAQELRTMAQREPDPGKRWGKVAEGVSATKSQSIAGAIKKGEAVGFDHTTEGHYEAAARKSEVKGKAKAGDASVLYDVWARWCPANET